MKAEVEHSASSFIEGQLALPEKYGIPPSRVHRAFQANTDRSDLEDLLRRLMEDQTGRVDAVGLLLLIKQGAADFVHHLSLLVNLPHHFVMKAFKRWLSKQLPTSVNLSGSEAVAALLASNGVTLAFAYPGTSELALCGALARMPQLALINGRGDKETVFLAGGACLRQPGSAIGVVHGARGLTNSLGAIASLRRNEVGVLIIVGLPTTASSRYLPPHGETALLDAAGNFVKCLFEVVPRTHDLQRDGLALMDGVESLIEATRSAPHGPALLGLPQDLAQERWVPWRLLLRKPLLMLPRGANTKTVQEAAEVFLKAKHPIILVDDYALRYHGLPTALATLAETLGAPVMQVRYRRGPMLFSRLSYDINSFVGWFDPEDDYHRNLMSTADILITIEDRNMYPRVTGPLPTCPKIVITSDLVKAQKNEYITERDVVLEGDVLHIIIQLCVHLRATNAGNKVCCWKEAALHLKELQPAGRSHDFEPIRRQLVLAIADAMRNCESRQLLLVDDSQMFGGLIGEYYDLLPSTLQVVGDHSGFVGGGIAFALGIAIATPNCRVLCTLGDHGFSNAFQALTVAVEREAAVVFLVCNNRGSVSLTKESTALLPVDDCKALQPLLVNPPLNYAKVARAIGLDSYIFILQGNPRQCTYYKKHFRALARLITKALLLGGPSLIELRIEDQRLWEGIWRTRGYEPEGT